MTKRGQSVPTTENQDGLSTPLEPFSNEHRNFLLVMLSLVVITLWGFSLRGSLWIDELGTYWVIKDGLSQTVHRATQIQGQTPLYYVIEWGTRAIGGKSELVLRLPSLLAMALTTYLVYRICVRLLDRESAIVATIVFSTLDVIAFQASDARPYSIALLILVAATLFMLRWMDSQRVIDGVGYVLLAALTVYAHYLFGLGLLAHIVYAYANRDRVRLKGVLFALGGTSLLLVPALPQFLSLFHRRASLSVPGSHFGHLLFDTLMPSVLVGGVLLGLLIAHLIKPVSLRRANMTRGALALIAGWLLIAPVILFMVSTFTSIRIFTERYLLVAAPALALLTAAAIRRIEGERPRRIIVLTVVVCSVLIYGSATHNNEDWRDGIAAVNSLVDQANTPVLVHSALVEAAQTSWLRDPYKASYLMDPVSYYPVRGHPIPMPYFFNESARNYLESMIPMLKSVPHFIFITRFAFVEMPQYLEGRLLDDGFRLRTAAAFGNITVYDFRKKN